MLSLHFAQLVRCKDHELEKGTIEQFETLLASLPVTPVYTIKEEM